MRKLTSITALALSVTMLCAATDASARVRLLSAIPAPDGKASGVKNLSLVFSESVTAGKSGVDLVMTGMPGMASHAPMKVSGFRTLLSADGHTLTIALPRALPAGTYRLDWHAVTADSSSDEGSYAFSAR